MEEEEEEGLFKANTVNEEEGPCVSLVEDEFRRT